VLAGGGLNQVPPGLAQNFLSSLSCPVVASLGGLDVLDHYDGKFLGLIGSFGQDAANKALETCDVLLVLGSRLAERQIEHRNISAKIIHVDIDPYELGRAVKEEISLHVCLETFLRMFQAPQNLTSRSACWAADLKQEQEGARELAADNIGLWFSEFIQPGDILCADVGLNQMGLARHIKLRSNRLLNSGGLGAMGYALPAAIGASYAAPEHRIWCFAGDGGIQMNIQELQTVAREGLPIKIVVVNNQSLGMIRKYHELAFAGRTVGSVQGYSAPDFGKLAKAYGLEYRQAADPEQLRQSLAALSSREAFLLEIVCRV